MPDRRLPPDEVDAILHRAARRDSSPNLPVPHDPTVPELMQIAEEVGLDPLEVRRAATVRPVPTSGAMAAITGGPARTEVRAEILSRLPGDRAELRRIMEEAIQRPGRVVVDEPDVWVWEEDHTVGRTHVDIQDGSLQLRIDHTGHYAVGVLGGLVLWAVATALVPFGLGPVAGLLGLLVAPVVLARPWWAWRVRKRRRMAEEAVMSLLRHIDEAAPGAPEADEPAP